MQAGKDYQIVPFDPMKHTAFVFQTFRESLLVGPGAQFPWKLVPWRLLVERLKKQLRTPGVVTKVAVGIPTDTVLMGWAMTVPRDNEVIFAFTKYEQRRFKIASALIGAAGVDLAKPTGLLYWTRAAQRIVCEHGFPLFFRVTDTAETDKILAAALAPQRRPSFGDRMKAARAAKAAAQV